jgi:hypothetical protein
LRGYDHEQLDVDDRLFEHMEEDANGQGLSRLWQSKIALASTCITCVKLLSQCGAENHERDMRPARVRQPMNDPADAIINPLSIEI